MLILLTESPTRPKVARIKQILNRYNIDVKTMKDVINDAINYIDQWRNRQKKHGLCKEGTTPTLPIQLYLLKLIEHLKRPQINKMLIFPKIYALI